MLPTSFSLLLEGEEEAALEMLKFCKESATNMSKEAGELADGFTGLANQTVDTAKETAMQRGAEMDKAEKMRKDIENWTAVKLSDEKRSEELVTLAAEMQKSYEEEKAAEEKAEERAFVVGITSAVFSGVGAGLGAFTGAKSGGMGNPYPNQPQGGPSPGQPAPQAPPPDVAPEAAEDPNAGADAAEEGAEPPAGGEAPSEGAGAAGAANAGGGTNAKTKAAAAGFNSAANSAQKVADQAGDAASNHHQMRMHFLNEKLKLEKERRDALSQIAEFAERIKDTTRHETIEKSIVLALGQAISALRQISTSLRTASLFWNLMAQRCDQLADSQLQKKISALGKLKKPIRIKFYSKRNFKETAVRYVAGWMGLSVVSKAYLDGIAETRKATRTSIDTVAVDPEQGRQKAQVLATQLSIAAKQDIDESIADSNAIAAERQAEQKSIAA